MGRVRLLVVCLVMCAVGAGAYAGLAVAVGSPRSARSGVRSRSRRVSHPRLRSRGVHRKSRRGRHRRLVGGRHARVAYVGPIGGSLGGGGLNTLTGGEQERLSRDAELASPPVVDERIRSQSAYEGLSSGQAQALIDEKFGGLIEQAEGGPPALAAGERIVGFPSDFGATVELPEGGHGALASVAPMAVETSSGRVPVDLVPRAQGTGFEPTVPSSGLHVLAGRNLSEGVSLTDIGVSLTPVTASGNGCRPTGWSMGQACSMVIAKLQRPVSLTSIVW
jgi:hypothetical protein